MKTDFIKERFLVLTNNESKIIAIIKSEKGLNNLAEKVVQSISEDSDAESVVLKHTSEIVLGDCDYEFDFTATIEVDEENTYDENFTLTFASVY